MRSVYYCSPTNCIKPTLQAIDQFYIFQGRGLFAWWGPAGSSSEPSCNNSSTIWFSCELDSPMSASCFCSMVPVGSAVIHWLMSREARVDDWAVGKKLTHSGSQLDMLRLNWHPIWLVLYQFLCSSKLQHLLRTWSIQILAPLSRLTTI